jgi:glycosyltransferase involved in cell wall biosynthesis
MKGVRASVIIPVYNARRYLDRCITGLLNQTYGRDRFQVIMVDNNSTDDSSRIIRQYASIELLCEARQGAYAARNRGISRATGDFLVFTDPDCVPEPHWLAALLAPFDNPTIRLTMGRSMPAGCSSALRLIREYEHIRQTYIFAGDQPQYYHGYTNNLAVRRTTFHQVGYFDERPRGSDTIFVQRLIELFGCDKVVYAPEARVTHLELDSVRVFLKKMVLYGRSSRLFSELVQPQPLAVGDRRKVFIRTVREAGLSRVQAVVLFGLLSAGVAAWQLGYRARFSLLRHDHTPARWKPLDDS